MPNKLYTALRRSDKLQTKNVQQFAGLLGLTINGYSAVEVPNRNGFVYVRLRENLNEAIQAFNEQVSPVYDLAVLVERRGNYYYVVSRDIARYSNWGSPSSYLPRHGNQHSFNPTGGGDIVFVYPKQIMPMLVMPSGSYGGSNVVLAEYLYKKPNGDILYTGNTGTGNILASKPTNNQAKMALIYLDTNTGNPGFTVGAGFSNTLTNITDIYPYIPSDSNQSHLICAAVWMASGTSALTWDNIYDVRQWFTLAGSGTGGGGISDAPSDGTTYGRNNASWVNITGSAGNSMVWNVITSDQMALINNGYLCNKSSLLTLTLPTGAIVGSRIQIAEMNISGSWKLAQNLNGIIHFGNKNTTIGISGSLSSFLNYDAVELVCCVANLEWIVISSQGNIMVA